MTSSDNQETQQLPAEFYNIEKKLEEVRFALSNKTKGLFKRVFLIIFPILIISFLLIVYSLNENQEFNPVNIIGPVIISFFLSLIAAGIYKLVRKGSDNYKFPQQLKTDLVSKITTFVNPNLTFFQRGITRKEFDNADLFNGSSFISEDTIEGTVDNTRIIASECTKKSDMGIFFNGLFFQLEMNNITISNPLKVFPTSVAENYREKIRDYKGIDKWKPNKLIKNDDQDRIVLDPSIQNSDYEIYCKSKSEAIAILSTKLIKLIDTIFAKFGVRDVFISLHHNMFYLGLSQEQDRNMLDTDTHLKNNLIENRIAEQIHQDVNLVNQVMKELSLINKL